MNKCFITKLPSSVDNDNLPVLGQLRIKMLKQNALPNNGIRAIQLATDNSITVKISGAHFTDNTLTSNNGNIKTITDTDGDVTLYVSNDTDAIITIDNKYSLTKLICNIFLNNDLWRNPHSIYFDIEDIKYCTNLNYLDLRSTQASGDISALSKLINLNTLSLERSQASGDISALSNLINLNALSLANSQVHGDISALSNLINLNALSLDNSQVRGDISALSKLTNITELTINSTNISGTFDNLTNFTKLQTIWADNTLLTGDMSKIPSTCMGIYITSVNSSTSYTWSAKSRQNVKLLSISGYITMDTTSIDNMLIDQATCKFSVNEHPSWFRIINVNGTRTSASDAAITAIQNMGVTITGITKAS